MPDTPIGLTAAVSARDRAVRALADHLQAAPATCPGCPDCDHLRTWLDWAEGQVALATARIGARQ